MRSLRIIAIPILALPLLAGAVQELIVPGLQGGQTQPLIVGIIGIIACLLAIGAGVLLWRRSPLAPRIAAAAGGIVIVFHTVAALPPRNVGMLALVLGIILGALLILSAMKVGVRRPDLIA